LYLLKSRGMPHSNQVREFLMTSEGIRLRNVYVGPEGVMTGSARLAQEAREREQALLRQQEIDRRTQEFTRRRRQVEAQIEELRQQLAEEEREVQRLAAEAVERDEHAGDERALMSRSRDVAEGWPSEYDATSPPASSAPSRKPQQ